MHRHIPQYYKSNIRVARMLRKGMTDAERKIWSLLRNNNLGVKFRRQAPFGEFVLDFYSAAVKLNVELDGSQHYTEKGRRDDRKRDDKLQESGIKVLRFSSADALVDPTSVAQIIFDEIERIKKQTPILTFP